MAFNYENDVKRLGGNLQTTVAYLLSLHKNEYEWNLLGIKVVGHVDALPIPDGTYEYGDAYTVGTAAPYDMWIYTRADEFHSEAYWFNIGKFPAPGPQGPKGDGLEQINNWTNGTVNNVTYDIINGAKVTQLSTVDYKDSTNGSTKQQQFETTTTLPITPGKYISMGATSDHKKMEVRVNGTALSQDYIKLDKTKLGVIPQNNDGVVNWVPTSVNPTANSIVQRNADGDCGFHFIKIDGITNINSREIISYWQIWRNLYSEALSITKTDTDTGILTVSNLTELQAPGYHMVKYKGQLYYRYDPREAPDGTLNYIHLDYIQDGNGGYKATGKCFSVTVSTRAWKVFDLDFGGKVYKHAIHFELTGAGTSSTANVWDIELVITTSSPNKITKDTLYKYISTSDYPLQGGTPISVYRARVQGPQGMGIGKMAVRHEVGEISNTDHYIFELMSMDGISETITERDQNSLSSFTDTVTEV